MHYVPELRNHHYQIAHRGHSNYAKPVSTQAFKRVHLHSTREAKFSAFVCTDHPKFGGEVVVASPQLR